jgi:hypothetical protein
MRRPWPALGRSATGGKKKGIYIYITIILPVLFGCETWSLKLREVQRISVFQIRVLRRLFGPKRGEVTGGGENYIMWSLMSALLTKYYLGDQSKKNELGGACSTHGGEVYTEFWWGNLV